MSSLERCPNCDAPLHGAYCSACGQKAELHLDAHGFVHDAMHEFLHLDGKILQSLKLLLFRPGQLTRDFLDGRRARYISPIRLYLTFSVLFFALTAVLPHRAGSGIIKVGSGKTPKGITLTAPTDALDRRMEAGARKAQQDEERLSHEIAKQLPRTMFVLMPLFALLTWAFFRKQERHYIAHLYYSIHFHAFVFAVLSVIALFSAIQFPYIALVLQPLIVVYHFMALRRVFGTATSTTIWKGLVVGVAYLLTVGVGVGLMVAAVLLTL